MSLIVDIRKKAGDFYLDVAFEMEGGVHAIMGASGCGKSMTLKCIAGILEPDEGIISLDGKMLFDSAKRINLPPQKRKVGYMFQDYALFPTMTVLQNVMSGMGKRKDPEKALDFLRRFQVGDLCDRHPGKLSGGQKQRVAMARIAAQEPSLILLDEPFSALDEHMKWALQNEMKSTLAKMEIPAVMVTHSRDEVYRLCTSVCCLNSGKSENVMAVRDFFRDPQTVAGARLSGCKNISPAESIDEHTLRAADWGVNLNYKKGISADIPPEGFAVGIRAHKFHAVRQPEDDNVLEVKRYIVLEDPFEWNVSFYPEAGGGSGTALQPLLWRTAKTEGSFSVPERLFLCSDDIMLLK